MSNLVVAEDPFGDLLKDPPPDSSVLPLVLIDPFQLLLKRWIWANSIEAKRYYVSHKDLNTKQQLYIAREWYLSDRRKFLLHIKTHDVLSLSGGAGRIGGVAPTETNVNYWVNSARDDLKEIMGKIDKEKWPDNTLLSQFAVLEYKVDYDMFCKRVKEGGPEGDSEPLAKRRRGGTRNNTIVLEYAFADLSLK